MPPEKINDDLSKIIFQLSHHYITPLFPPHITLLGELTGSPEEISIQTRQLAAHLQPFHVTLTTVDFLNEYFRCLFLRVEETSNLMEANREARIIFHREPDPAFMPHLSLLYGDFDDVTKKQIINSIGQEFIKSFSVSYIHLISTTGEPKDWFRIQKNALRGRQSKPHE